MHKRITEQFESAINKINILYGLIVPIVGLSLMAMTIRLTHPTYFQAGSLPVYYAVIGSVGAVMAFHLIRISSMNRTQFRWLYIYYHIALCVYCVFVAPYNSPMNVLWVLLAVGMDLLYGYRWVSVTLVAYVSVLILSYIRTGDGPYTLLVVLVQILYVVAFLSVVLLVSKYRQVSDKERETIDRSFNEKELERQRLLSLINSMSDAVVAIDEKGKILIYNSGFLILLDTNSNLSGKDIGSEFELNDVGLNEVNLIDLVKKTPQGFISTDYIHTFGPGDAMNLFVSATPIRLSYNERGADAGYIVIMRDITKQKSLEDEQSEFINVVGHELRTPVAIAEGAIGNSLLYSQKGNVDPHIVGSLQQAHKQVKFLASMVNDISTLNRAENSDDPLKLAEIDPVQFMEDLARDYQHEAALSKLKLITKFEKRIAPISTEELYLHEILQNFITNAIKYTHEGSVTLSVKKASNGVVIFSVTDTGIGMNKTDQDHVFEKFYRSEDYRTRESGGTGLGLYIAAKLAHKINAEIKIKSSVGVGTTFSIEVSSVASGKKDK